MNLRQQLLLCDTAVIIKIVGVICTITGAFMQNTDTIELGVGAFVFGTGLHLFAERD